MVNKEEYPGISFHRLGRAERAAHVWVDKGDKIILKLYKGVLKSTITGALHFLIGTGARCHEEKHLERIAFLEERVRGQARIILAYLEKYGPLREKK
ncbi:hypothetical protein ACFLW8_01155 [Chloroflexota bacterium]